MLPGEKKKKKEEEEEEQVEMGRIEVLFCEISRERKCVACVCGCAPVDQKTPRLSRIIVLHHTAINIIIMVLDRPVRSRASRSTHMYPRSWNT